MTSEKEADRMHVGLAPLTVGRPSPPALVTAAAAADFRRVGMTFWLPGSPPSLMWTARPDLRALLSQLDASGVSVVDVGVVVLSGTLDLTAVARLVEAAAVIGADRLVVINQDGDPGRAAAGLAAVCGLAGPAGMTAAVEFMPYSASRSLQEAATLVSAAGAPNAGLVVDVLHLFRSGGSATDLSAVDPRLIQLVQLCDARRAAPRPDRLRAEALGDRLYPGEGELPVADVLRAVPASVPLTIEAPVARDAHRSPDERALLAAAALRAFLGASGGAPA